MITIQISLEQLKIQTSNFTRGLKVRDWILNKNCKTSQNGAWPTSRPTSRSRDILNIQATEALKNGKIRESIAFDLQHGYLMWTWFVNFWDQKEQKLISKTEYQPLLCVISPNLVNLRSNS